MSEFRAFHAPGYYVQGPGLIDRLTEFVGALGTNPLIVSETGAFAMFDRRLQAQFPGSPALCLDGEITRSAVARLAEEARRVPFDVVIAVGGGKALDAGKYVSRSAAAKLASVPTIASNDAPTSSAIALYSDDEHRLVVESLGRNPDLVVVDTQVIASAPAHFLRWGIGDALAKAGEARGCAKAANGRTPGGMRPLRSGLALAVAAYDTLRESAASALKAVERGELNRELEDVVEAVILMSGLGFENGGLGLAHAMTRGLMRSERTRRYAHGEHVAYGMLVQSALSTSGVDLREEVDFVASIGLPSSLSAFGGGPVTALEMRELAEQAMTARPHVDNWIVPLDADMIHAAIARLEDLA